MFGRKKKLNAGEEKETQSKRGYIFVGIFGGLILLGFLVILFSRVGEIFALGKEGDCVPPQTSIYKYVGTGTYYHEESGSEVMLIRGVANADLDIHQKKDTSLPPCFSKDKGLMSVYNLRVVDSSTGESVVLTSAVIARSEQLLGWLIHVPQDQEVPDTDPLP